MASGPQPDERPGAGLPPRDPSPSGGDPHVTPRPDTSVPGRPGGPPAGDSVVLLPGMRPLPEYELVRRLGRGGFGEVWEAKGPGDFSVALKFVRLEDRAAEVEVRALEVMRHIRHPYLLPMFGAWHRDGYLIVAMELAERTLLQRLDEARAQGLPGIPREELLGYVREAATGIDFLNDRRHPGPGGGAAGIQHRDVKPQNLLLIGGAVKVADFGLAKLLEHSATAASGGMSPAYAAPEFFTRQATRWSDQYCLAVTYCQLRGGRLPYEGNAMQIMAGHVMQPPDLTMLPEAERPAVARALAKEPEKRWPSCRAFVDALAAGGPRQAVTPATPAELPTIPAPAPPVRPVPARWLGPALVGAALLLLALTVGLALLRTTSPGGSEATVSGPTGRPATERVAESLVARPTGPDTGQAAPPTTTGRGALERVTEGPAAAAAAPAATHRAAPPPPPASLQVLPLAGMTVDAGKAVTVEVKVQRRNCTGPVSVEVTGLPARVSARPVVIPATEDSVRIEVAADDDAEEASRRARVRARLGALNDEREVDVAVRVPPVLGLLPLAGASLAAGEHVAVEVRVKRRNCPGPVRLRLEDLPEGVRAEPAVIADGEDAGSVEVYAEAGVPSLTREVRVVALAAASRAEGRLPLNVAARVAAPPLGDEHTFAIRVASMDRLIESLHAIAGRIGAEDGAKEFEKKLLAAAGENGQKGLDRTRPLGLFGTVRPNAIESTAVALIPVKDEQAVLGLLDNLGYKATKEDDGVYSFTTAAVTWYFRFANRYAYLTVMGKDALDTAKLPAPRLLFSGDDTALVSLTVRLDRIPEEVKKAFLDQLQEQPKAPDERRPEETEAQHELKAALVRELTNLLRTVVQGGRAVDMSLEVDPRTNEVVLRADLDALTSSGASTLLQELGRRPSLFAGLAGNQSAFTFYARLPELPPPVRDSLSRVLNDSLTRSVAGVEDKEKRDQAERLINALAPTLKSGEVDLGVAFRGPSADKTYTLVGGLKVQNGRALDQALRELIDRLPEEKRKGFRPDVARVGGVAIHRLDLSAGMTEQARKTFGTDAEAYVAVRPDDLLFTVGPDALAAIKDALVSAPRRDTSLVLEVAVGRLTPLMEPGNPEATKIAEELFKQEGRDRVTVVVTAGHSLHLTVRLSPEVIGFFSRVGASKKPDQGKP